MTLLCKAAIAVACVIIGASSSGADALLTPRATREEDLDEAAAVGVCGADRSRGDLVPGFDDAPQRRVEPLAHGGRFGKHGQLEGARRPRDFHV